MKLKLKTFCWVLVAAAGLAGIIAIGERARADVSVFSPVSSLPPNVSVTMAYTTWANAPTGSVDLSLSPQQFTMTSDCAVTNFINAAAAGYENQAVMWFTNSATTNCTLRVTASGYTDVGTGARSYVVTNGSQRVIAFHKNDMGYHGQSQPSF